MKYDYTKTREGLRRFANPKIYRITFRWQQFLHFIGVAWHNTYSGECTSDFNCCVPDIGRKSWVNIPEIKCCIDGECGKCRNCRIDPL